LGAGDSNECGQEEDCVLELKINFQKLKFQDLLEIELTSLNILKKFLEKLKEFATLLKYEMLVITFNTG
jgi:hypothetical protein